MLESRLADDLTQLGGHLLQNLHPKTMEGVTHEAQYQLLCSTDAYYIQAFQAKNSVNDYTLVGQLRVYA